MALADSGNPVDFYWIGEASELEEAHVEAAVSALMEATAGDTNRLTNPHMAAAARASFRERLERMRQGKLRPPDELKSISRSKVKLFEVRWPNIRVAELNEEGKREAKEIHLRMIYAEPPELGDAVLGLHAHEKVIDARDSREIRSMQDEEIDYAAKLYEDGEGDYWGVTVRT